MPAWNIDGKWRDVADEDDDDSGVNDDDDDDLTNEFFHKTTNIPK